MQGAVSPLFCADTTLAAINRRLDPSRVPVGSQLPTCARSSSRPSRLAGFATVYNLAIIVVFAALTASLTVFWAANALLPRYYSPRLATGIALVATAPAGLLLIHLGIVAVVGLDGGYFHGLRSLVTAIDRAGLMIGVMWHGGTTLLLWRAMMLYGGG